MCFVSFRVGVFCVYIASVCVVKSVENHMDRINPNCIAGASGPYKVVSFTVPAEAPGSLSVRPSVRLEESL